jgi:ribosomal 50S subunit-recycling heat shock protein
MSGARIDKWLWAARLSKRGPWRSTPANSVAFRTTLTAKPAREEHVGAGIKVKNESGEFGVEVNGLSHMRAPAPVARTLYSETAASQLRLKLAEERRAMPYVKTVHTAKPTVGSWTVE